MHNDFASLTKVVSFSLLQMLGFYFLYLNGTFLRTSSDQVVDSDNIFIVDVTVVIFHTHLSFTCRCMLNNKKKIADVSFSCYVTKIKILLRCQDSQTFHKADLNITYKKNW